MGLCLDQRMASDVDSPRPLVKSPKLLGGRGGSGVRPGRGFSLQEIEAVGLSSDDARLIGIVVDPRRKTSYEWNIKALREYLEKVKQGNAAKPALAIMIKAKESSGRTFRGLTPAGHRSRGLRSIGLRETHVHKWKKKQNERESRKRHEAVRRKGGN
jgi:large subunit ribosomal protein L13e